MANYVAGLLGFNFSVALIMFAIIIFSLRKKRAVTALKGFAIFAIGWLGGTFVVFVFHVLFRLAGTIVQAGQLEAPVSILVITPVMYAAFRKFSEAKTPAP